MSTLQNVSPSEPPQPGLSHFIVGRDGTGQWIALESRGLAGGLFRSQEAALRYATFETDHRQGAVRVVAEPLALRL